MGIYFACFTRWHLFSKLDYRFRCTSPVAKVIAVCSTDSLMITIDVIMKEKSITNPLKSILGCLSLFGVMAALLLFLPGHVGSTAEAQTTWSNTNAAPPVPSIVDDFVPEFVDLPNFGEGDEQAVPSGSKLIDIAEFQSPDEQWPSYSRSELPVESGETWLGLYASKGELQLASTKLTRSPREGYVGAGDEPYDWLKYERKGELIFLVNGVPELKPGNVTTLFSREASDKSDSLEGGYKRTFRLGVNSYVLRVTTGLQRDGGKVNVLILESGGKSQIVTFNLYYKDHNTLYNIIGDLIWAGDIDGDGKLDLYFSDYNFEKGGFGSNFYLSRQAADGKLVRRVAVFGSVGC